MSRVKFKPVYMLSILAGIMIVLLAVKFQWGQRFFFPLIILSLVISSLHFWIDFFTEQNRQKLIEVMFLEFIRNLSESIKAGISIPRSIQNIAKRNYGELTPYIQKLSNQIEWGIPTRKALQTFAEDTENRVIIRSIALVSEAEKSGGDITDIFSSVVESVVSVKQIKGERKSQIHSQVVQGYIIYYVFIGIMLVLDLWLFPQLTGVETSSSLQAGASGMGGMGLAGAGASALDMGPIFLTLILIQGFFAGIMIGKFSEGTIKNGLLHSLIMMVSAALLITT